jgi:HD superfamily phosphohydrolase
MNKRQQILSFEGSVVVKNYQIIESADICKNEPSFISPIGEGGSGVVFLAKQELFKEISINRAIKFFIYKDEIAEITAHKEDGPISTDDFQNEVLNISSFNHENLVKIIDAGILKREDLEIPYLVTEYIEGPTLQEILAGEGKEKFKNLKIELIKKWENEPVNILEFLIEIANGIKHLHDRNFFHCDIAPKNIFIDSRLKPIIGDLGVGKSISEKKKKYFIAGTKSYMPQQALNYLNSEVTAGVFKKLQPHWDLFAFSKIGVEIVDKFIPEKKTTWRKPLLATLIECKEGIKYQNIDLLIERFKWLRPVNREMASVPELSASLSGKTTKLLPVENLVLSKRVKKLIEHPGFTRLSKVRQLTTFSNVFPGATHSRFEHSLGVLENMRRYLIALLDRDEFLEHFNVEKIETALVCALFSSLSKFPFSNIIHEISGRNQKYLDHFSKENILTKIFEITNEENETLEKFVLKHFPGINFQTVKNILTGKSQDFENEDSFIYSLLNSSLDTRVIDFVRRDSLHLGISTGDLFILEDLLRGLTIYNHKLALFLRGVSIAEQIISMRYWLYSRIYYSRPNRTYVTMVRQLLVGIFDLGEDQIKNFIDFCLNSDEANCLKYLYDKSLLIENKKLIDISKMLTSEEPKLFFIATEICTSEKPKLTDPYNKIGKMNLKEISELQDKIYKDLVKSYDSLKDFDEKSVFTILIDLPTEPNGDKLGDDIVVIVNSEKDEISSLNKTSGIINGINASFQSYTKKLRILIHPNIFDVLNKNCNKNELEDFIEKSLMKHIL